MRFSLQDIKKQVHRRSGELFVSLHFLKPNELSTEIERLIAYYEGMLGLPQHDFSFDEARACIGEYRLANCLLATLGNWYSWQPCAWEEVLQGYGDDTRSLFSAAAITSPIHLRLALFTCVNQRYGGFLDTRMRASALAEFAAMYHLSVAELEYLLSLDRVEQSVLRRTTSQKPTAQEVSTLYNQWAFEAALFAASNVHFAIDCSAFEAARQQETGIGALIKRLCFLARISGVYYDLAYERLPVTAGTREGMQLHLTLYGPQEMTGAPQQYGMRLARLCRILLGYRARTGNSVDQLDAGAINRAPTMVIPLEAILEARAIIHFLQRSYAFAIDKRVLSLLPSVEGNIVASEGTSGSIASTSSLFDSGIEQSFAEAFSALEARSAVDGWSMIREPEPLLLDSSIFIPDFALTRDSRRIYVEILGFW
ncbi:MAG: DUF790 family protein, partial [Chloroflexota bacterium]|nr:DUF790 family protein [Chloroflexota bacterium]